MKVRPLKQFRRCLLPVLLTCAWASDAAVIEQTNRFDLDSMNPGPTAATSVAFAAFDQSLGRLDSVSWFLDDVSAEFDRPTDCFLIIDPDVGGCFFATRSDLDLRDPYLTTTRFRTFNYTGFDLTESFSPGEVLGNAPPNREPFTGTVPVEFELQVSNVGQILSDNFDVNWQGVFNLNYDYTDSAGNPRSITQAVGFSLEGPLGNSTAIVSFEPFDSSLGTLTNIAWDLDDVQASYEDAPNCLRIIDADLGIDDCVFTASTSLEFTDPYGDNARVGGFSYQGFDLSKTFADGPVLNNAPPVTDPFLGTGPVVFDLLADTFAPDGQTVVANWTGDLTLRYEFTEFDPVPPAPVPIAPTVWLFAMSFAGLVLVRRNHLIA